MIKPEILDIFDKHNRLIGNAERSRVHSEGLFHRSVIVLVLNSKGDLFLQRRDKTKDVCPLAWDVSVAGHLEPSEDYEVAARRELMEELDVASTPIKLRDVHLQMNEYEGGKIKDNEFVVLYKLVWDGDIQIDTTEVKEGSFFPTKKIEQMIEKDRQAFTPWFLDEWEYLTERNLI